MGWYLGHFPGAKRVRNELVHINSLADVEHIIQNAFDHPEDYSEDVQALPIEEPRDPEVDLVCTV
jgi:hypothetical protein